MKKLTCIIILHFMVFFSPWAVLGDSSNAISGRNSVEITFRAPRLSLSRNPDGSYRIRGKGIGFLMKPGNPRVPEIRRDIKLVGRMNPGSMELHVVNEEDRILGSRYEIEPTPPMLASPGDVSVVNWDNSGKIVGGKNVSIYRSTGPYPRNPVAVKGWKTRGKVRFLKLAYYPLRYYPASGKVEIVESITFRLTFTAAEEKEKKILATESPRTYRSGSVPPGSSNSENALSGTGASHDYVIITSGEVVTNSQKLNDFILLKEAMGHNVLVVTEDQYGELNGPPPDGTAEKIRQWLMNNYETMGIKYVLLIGNPDPSTGDVPMKKCYPRSHESTHRETLTDYYYADLTGNWDADADGLYGEYPDDNKAGGVDYAAEVWVGRIPVYNGDYETLDNILQKIIDYETEPGDISWRKKALFPDAILNFEQEPPSNISRTDGAELARNILADFLAADGFESYTLYEKEGINPSPYPCDAPLNRLNAKDEWSTGYGVVWAVGHGSQTGIYRKYWQSDDNGNEVADKDETVFVPFFTGTDTSALDDTHPAITYLCACNNGYPENSANLGYSLLKHGAVATVSASRVSWYTAGWSEPAPNYGDNFSIGYYLMEKLTRDNMPYGKALALVKEALEYDSSSVWVNLQAFNLYGDPETTLTGTFHHCQADFDYDGDVDGSDLSRLAEGDAEMDLSQFAEQFGKENCDN